MPAMSVSQNSTRRVVTKEEAMRCCWMKIENREMDGDYRRCRCLNETGLWSIRRAGFYAVRRVSASPELQLSNKWTLMTRW
ncbi:MAG: hypothetical protein ABGZ24_17480, partial [Fuerstiella sp.]